MIQALLYSLPEITLLTLASAMLLFDVCQKHKRPLLAYGTTQLILVIVAFLVNRTAFLPPQIVFDGHFILDPLALVLKLVVLLTVFVTLLYARSSKETPAQAEYYTLILFATLGMMLIISSHSLLMLYLGLELFSLSLYALVAMNHQTLSTEAAMKYFVLGALASGFFLYGLSLLFGVTGSLDLDRISFVLASIQAHNPLLWVGLLFIMAGFLFKWGGAPFHMWIPDVYEGAPLPITLFIASAPKIAAFALTYRLLSTALIDLSGLWWPLLGVVAVLSLAIGNWGALVQTNIKRLLAYSTIAQVGFILLGLMIGADIGFEASLLYTLIYVFTTTAAFGILLWLSKHEREIITLQDLQGLSQQYPWMAFLLLLVCFSLAGVPPLAGFFAKFWVLQGLIDQGMVALALLAVVFSVIGAVYYLKLIKIMYFEAPVRPWIAVTVETPWILSLNTLLILFFGIYPAGIMTLCQNILD